MFRLIMLTSILLIVCLCCCPAFDEQSPPAADSRPSQQVIINTINEPDLSYRLEEGHRVPGVKRTVHVYLDRKAIESELKYLANKIKASDSRRYERTFICYHLPEQFGCDGYWATTHFDPNLKVEILGLSVEDDKAMEEKAYDIVSDKEAIGKWLDQSPLIGGCIVIYKESGEIYYEKFYANGGSSKKKVAESVVSIGRRFDPKTTSSGDHWIIDEKGDLQIRDNQGLVAIANQIN